jgi:predicted ribonuclease YlaK
LIHNPDLTSWRFPNVPQFTLVLTPTVLGELDQLKITHRVESVRDKAEKVIKQVQELRRRGRLVDGVPIVKGSSTVKAVAVEPDMSTSLPWLDASNNDDRLIASTLEVMRRYTRSTVILVTKDVNLQNKADFANIPSVLPPDP